MAAPDHAAADPERAELLGPGPLFELGGEAVNPACRGFTVVHNYAQYFWRPYLGNTAFSLWELLLSFCYGNAEIAFPSISRLARMLTNSDHSRAVVRGRGGSRGALEVLSREGLVQIHRRGKGPMMRYTFRVCKRLPLLRPEQVARLARGLQRDHEAWLDRLGIGVRQYRQAFAGHSAASGPDHQACAETRGAATSPTSPGITAGVPGNARPGAGHGTSAVPGGTGGDRCATNKMKEEDELTSWWRMTEEELFNMLPPSVRQQCLEGTEPVALHEGVLTLRAPGAVVSKRLANALQIQTQFMMRAFSGGKVREVRLVGSQADLPGEQEQEQE